ncbi:Lin-54-like [Trema orientale]|uniref:Lin-54-like n=1 Tax=Trema orientale TaxID=63057 RepID=A0A2P5D6Y1_TREOI|nr:Lin-54-like [Trema orientale]
MEMALVSVQGPYQLQAFQFSYGTRLHGSRTLKIRPLKHLNLLSSSSSSSSRCSASVVEEGPPPPPPDDSLAVQSDSAIEEANKLPLSGCKACGREVVENGCNGEGRIQGGIATIPGFGWWPIKAYRPCPGFLAAGGRYRRSGQSMDEVAFGRGQREASLETSTEIKSRLVVGSHELDSSLFNIYILMTKLKRLAISRKSRAKRY